MPATSFILSPLADDARGIVRGLAIAFLAVTCREALEHPTLWNPAFWALGFSGLAWTGIAISFRQAAPNRPSEIIGVATTCFLSLILLWGLGSSPTSEWGRFSLMLAALAPALLGSGVVFVAGIWGFSLIVGGCGIALGLGSTSLAAFVESRAWETALLFAVMSLRQHRQLVEAQLRHTIEHRESELRKSLQIIRSGEERLNLFTESVPVGLFEAGVDGCCVYANSSWRSITGFSMQEAVSQPWFRFIHPEDRERVRLGWTAELTEGEGFSGLFRTLHSDGSFGWVQVRSNPMYSDHGVTYVGTIEDVTQRIHEEDELRNFTQELVRVREHEAEQSKETQKLVKALEAAKADAEAATRLKSEFLANMSHEIRTPMTAILGYADVLLEQTIDQPQLADPLKTVKRNGEHLLEIINDILDLSKIEAGKVDIEQIRANPLQTATDTIDLMKVRALDKGLELSWRAVTPMPESALIDPTRIRQIVLNLISNALKFTSRGKVELEIGYHPHLTSQAPSSSADSETTTLVNAAESAVGGEFRFAVRDSGIGMTTSQVERLFRPFTQADFSTTRKFGGTGLGLTISRHLARLMGGDLTLQTELGVGSVFTLALPAIAPVIVTHSTAFAQSAVLQAMNPVTTLPACRILLAEDGPDNQRLIAFLLKKAGAEVSVVENGQQAIDAALQAETAGRPFDIVLMDMQMPVCNGYDASRQLTEQGYPRPIIALTAHAMSGDREKCLAAGCRDYATKPIHRNQLMKTICTQLQQGPQVAVKTEALRAE